MAEFCEHCIKECMGFGKENENYKFWLVSNGGICEGCGYKYLEKTND